MVTSLTGPLFLLTDKPERWRTPFVDPTKRTAPVLVTTPGQLYDVDPSRSSELWRVEGEVSGRDPKPFDAGLTPAAHLYLLEVNRPFESWVVLGRTGGELDEIRFDELGLDPARRYHVFEFWEKKDYGADPLPIDRQGGLVSTGCRPTAGGEIAWRARFARPMDRGATKARTGRAPG